MPLWLVLSIVTFALWGFWGFFAKIASDSIDARSAAILQGLGAFVVTLGILATQRFRIETHLGGTSAALIAGAVFMVGIVTFTTALSGGRASIVVPLSALYPVVTIALGIIFLSEALSLSQASGVGLALIAIVLMSR
jgi:transporter family protein